MKLKLIFGVLILGLFFAACGDDEEETPSCDTTDITYTNTVAAIFNASCATPGCHVDGNEATALFSLEGFQNAKVASEAGRMLGSINQDSGFSPMPRGGSKLEDCDIDKITAWISAGSPE